MTQVNNYKCTLTTEVLDKAMRELNEDPSTRKQEIATLRERLLKYPGLKARVDDAHLLKFLRARKFDQERTFELILNYYKMKKDNEDLYAELTPKAVQQLLKAGVAHVLPHRSKAGEAIMVLRLGRWDPDKNPLTDVFRTNMVVLTHMLMSEETQVNGVRIINDLTDIGWTHAKSMSPIMARKLTSILQDAFPMRLKGIHYVHEPTFFDYIFAIIRPFLKEKLQKRLNFHGEKVEELHETIEPECLPEEYKGTQPCFDTEAFCKQLLDKEAEYEENAKFGFVSMTIQQQSKKSEDAIENLPGTFKKLNVD